MCCPKADSAKLGPSGARGSAIPSFHGRSFRRPPTCKSPAGLDHEIVQATVTENPDRSIDRITLADSTKMRASFRFRNAVLAGLVQFE
jgi:hypothetical protein